MAFLLLLSLLFIAGFLVIAIFFLLTLQNTMKAVSPQNRRMEPGKVWLWLIPFFNLVWQFIVVKKISDSIEAEYLSRGMSVPPQPTYNIGLAMCIGSCLQVVLYRMTMASNLVSVVTMICFIIYWIQVNDYKKRLQQLPPLEYNDSEIFGNLNR